MSILRTRNKNTNQWEEIQAIKGEQGIQGPQGPQGPQGDDYEITSEDYQEIANVVETDIQPILDNKVDKVEGKGLSTNDFTDTYKTKVDNNTSARHTHPNKTAIDSISSTDISNWNAKADPEDIPTKTSQLTNNSGFITNTVNNLVNYQLKTSTGSLISMEVNSSNYVVTVNLKNSAGTVISSDTIDLPLESVVVSGRYDSATKKVILTLKNGSEIEFSVADLISGLQTEITSANKLDSDLVDDTNQTNKFVTDAEKTTWNSKVDTSTLNDYVQFIDYMSTTKVGVGKTGNAGVSINPNTGMLYIAAANQGVISGKSNSYLPIVPRDLDYATKIGITTNTIPLTSQEQEDAKTWLGANFNNTVKGKDLDLKDTTASKIPAMKLYGKSSQDINTGSNLVQYTSTNTDYFFCNSGVIKFGTYTYVQDNGASLYFPEGAKTTGINTRVLVKNLNLEANKLYTITVEGGRDAGYGMNIAQYPTNAEDIYAREAVIGQGRNFTCTFTTEADKLYMLELRTPTAGEGGYRTLPFTMKIMVNEGGPKAWEPYTAGIPNRTVSVPAPITDITSENITITDGVNSQTGTLTLNLSGFKVDSGGNYIDNEGQMWLTDSIERYKDGTGKYIQRINRINGSYIAANAGAFYGDDETKNKYIGFSLINQPNAVWASRTNNICTNFPFTTGVGTSDKVGIQIAGNEGAETLNMIIGFGLDSTLTYNQRKDYIQNLTDTFAVEYGLKTPIETALTTEQLAQLDLSMYNVNTQITSNADIEIEYIAKTKEYIDNSLRELTYNRDKYTLLAETTITEEIVQPITWTSSGDDDVYDDVVVVAENLLGNGSAAFNIGYKLSNSTDFFTTNQSNILNATTVRNYFVETERYLPYKWKCTKRGAANAVADVTHTAIQPATEWQDKIKEIKVYTSGTGMQFVQGTIRVYGRKRF